MEFKDSSFKVKISTVSTFEIIIKHIFLLKLIRVITALSTGLRNHLMLNSSKPFK